VLQAAKGRIVDGITDKANPNRINNSKILELRRAEPIPFSNISTLQAILHNMWIHDP